jgi:hypothetical protein
VKEKSGGRLAFVIIAAAIVGTTCGGCRIPLGPWNGSAFQLDTDKIGSGEPAVQKRNDRDYWNGEPMDYRKLK